MYSNVHSIFRFLELLHYISPNHVGVKYSLVTFGLGEGQVEPFLFFALRTGKKKYFELKHWIFFMTKAALNRDICFIKAVLLW